MANPIRVGLFGLGKTGKAVAEQLLGDDAVALCWVISGGRDTKVELTDSLPIYNHKDVDLRQLISSHPVDFVVDF